MLFALGAAAAAALAVAAVLASGRSGSAHREGVRSALRSISVMVAAHPRRAIGTAAVAVGLVAAVATLAAVGLPVLGVAVAGGLGCAVWMARGMRRARSRRARRLALVEAIELLVQLLPTGQGLRQSLEVLAERGPAPLRADIGRLVERGRRAPFELAVRELEARIDDPLASLLAAALIVGNRSGGQLVPLFQELGRAARAVELVRGQVDAEQAQGRYGAAVICCMPVAILLVLRVVNPAYLAPYATATGQLVLGGIAAVMVLGYVWMRRILRLPEPDRVPLRAAVAGAASPIAAPPSAGPPRGRRWSGGGRWTWAPGAGAWPRSGVHALAIPGAVRPRRVSTAVPAPGAPPSPPAVALPPPPPPPVHVDDP